VERAARTGVLGVEDGCAAGGTWASGRRRTTTGYGPSACPHDRARGPARHPHAILSLPRPPGWSEVAAITLHDDTLTLRDITGDAIAVPFPEDHFA
jgi:hypothetical protein